MSPDYVAREDVDKAIWHMRKASLLDEDPASMKFSSNGVGGKGREDVISRVFNTIRDYSIASRKSHVEMQPCEAMVLS